MCATLSLITQKKKFAIERIAAIDKEGDEWFKAIGYFDMEPQRVHYPDQNERKFFYVVKIAERTLARNDEYTDLPYVYVIFINRDNDFAVDLIDVNYVGNYNGVYTDRMQIIDINMRKLNQMPDDMNDELKAFIYFFATGNDELMYTNAVKGLTGKTARKIIDLLTECMFWLKCNPEIKAKVIDYAQNNAISYFSEEELINIMPSLSAVIADMGEEMFKREEKRIVVKKDLGFALACVKESIDALTIEKMLQNAIPFFVIKKLKPSMTLDEAYELFMREMINLALKRIKSRKSMYSICLETGFSKALVKKLKAKPDLVLDDDALSQLETLAWIYEG
jgi:hypothetical protein